ncbi:unnamed protein product [Orchesella dallaii]|uniref:C2H2-type domain-containing protein n=1 Tax=Orchesella dallaii TaxID=48710 RepID=A0ABP1RHE5_9HEXA
MKIKHQKKRTGKKHQCQHCTVAFSLEQTLATHLKTCTKNPDNFIRTKTGRNTKKFRCPQCGIYVFQHSFRSRLLTHVDETEMEKANITFTCDICDNSYGSYHILNKHVYRVHKNIPRKKYNCEFCGITYKTRLSMNRHIDVFHKGIDPKVACNLCGKVLSNSSVLYVHMQSHKEVKKYGCHLCEVKYRNKKSLKYHLVKFHGKHVGEEFTPGEGSSLPQQNDGEKMEQQSEETPWKCDACGIFCSSETLLKRHMDFLHRKPKQRVVCQFCGKSYSGQWVLKEHIDVVHKGIDLSVVCDVCGKVLSSRNHLKTHMKVHGERKKYACHLCDVTVLSNKYLKKHLVNMHGKAVGEEFTPGEGLKFGCMFSSCGAKFGKDVELQQHVERNHAPVVDSKFMCTLCGKVFSNQARLTRHNLVHSKEKRLECHVCKKRFAYSSSLKDHLKVVHDLGEGQQYFRCEQPNCEAKFKLIKYLNKHFRDTHDVRKDIGNIKTETVTG